MRNKCAATGKTIFKSPGDAKESVLRFKAKLRIRVNGKRIKHRIKKPDQKRSYFCIHCKGYHLTSRDSEVSKRQQDNLKKSRQANKTIQANTKTKNYLPYPDDHGKAA